MDTNIYYERMVISMKNCKFISTCKMYDKDSSTCNKTGGEYYEGRMAG